MAKTYIPMLVLLASAVCKYVTRNRGKLEASLTSRLSPGDMDIVTAWLDNLDVICGIFQSIEADTHE